MKNKLKFYTVFLLSIFLLAACGGGESPNDEQASPATYRINTIVGMGGAISPELITVSAGDTASFSVVADNGFLIASVSGCSGNLSGSTYTTGSINSSCTVTASFIDNSVPNYTVTATASSGGSISPSTIRVAEGSTADFTLTTAAGFGIDSVTGCDGSLNGTIYTTAAVLADCSITASFLGLQTPLVSAGPDQNVDELSAVSLSGSASDSDGTIASYLWVQITGTPVTLTNSDTANATFDAPDVAQSETLMFELQVTDDDGQIGKDSVEIIVNPIVSNEIAVIAATGMPAVGFPSGYVYWNVFDPTIGDSGHVAYLGSADTSIRSTEQNRKALWAGLPNSIELILQENDALPDLPSNVLYGGNRQSSSNIPDVMINASGDVAHYTSLKGAVTDRNNEVLLVHENSNLRKVMRKGEQIDGFPTGSAFGSLLNYDFSDAGLVFTAQVISGNQRNGVGIWFWDFNDLTLLALAEFSSNDTQFDFPEEMFSIDGRNCKFTSVTDQIARSVQVNDRGDIVFPASFSTVRSTNCPYRRAFLKWNSGNFTSIVYDEQPVTGLNGYFFNQLGIFPKRYNLLENGDVALHSFISKANYQDGRSFFWVRKQSGEQEYLAIGGELFPGSSSQSLVNNLGGLGSSPIGGGQGNYLIGTYDSANREAVYLLKGTASPLPYSDISEVAASRLSTLVKVGDIPPDYPSTAFFSRIEWFFLFGPQMNASGEVVFRATREDALDSGTQVNGLWYADEAGVIKKLVEPGDTIPYNGENVALLSVSLSGLSNTGQVILSGSLIGSTRAVLLLNP